MVSMEVVMTTATVWNAWHGVARRWRDAALRGIALTCWSVVPACTCRPCVLMTRDMRSVACVPCARVRMCAFL